MKRLYELFKSLKISKEPTNDEFEDLINLPDWIVVNASFEFRPSLLHKASNDVCIIDDMLDKWYLNDKFIIENINVEEEIITASFGTDNLFFQSCGIPIHGMNKKERYLYQFGFEKILFFKQI